MTLTQLEYIIAIDTYKSFLLGAEKSMVTQPTLSMQIKKLEEELGIVIFDRTKQPVVPTDIGRELILQARIILSEANKISEIIKERKGEILGKLRVGIIPTIAPYLLPLFISSFLKKYPKLTLIVEEITTANLLTKLKSDQLDCGILATPIVESNFKGVPLFYEPFVGYVSSDNQLFKEKTIDITKVNLNEMWILNEGHCMRSQVENMCMGNRLSDEKRQFDYQSGSIETLKRLVETNEGFTILPELSITDFTDEQMEKVRFFKSPEPCREISIITHRNVVKKTILDALKKEIMEVIPEKMKKINNKFLISI